MGSLTTYGANKNLDHIFNSAYTPAATLYLVLCTADPTDAATGASCNEVANTGAYARTAITFGAAASRRVTQNAQVNFPKATAAWGTITHWCIADNATRGAGNILAHGAFSPTFQVVSGNTPRVASGRVYIEFTAGSGYGFTTTCCHNLLNLMFRNVAYTSPSGNTFLMLSNSVLSDSIDSTSGATEVSGTSYARVEVNPYGGSSPTWAAAAAGLVTNLHQVNFPTVGAGGWTQIVAAAIVVLASGAAGILVYDNTNVVDQTPSAGDDIPLDVGEIDISMT